LLPVDRPVGGDVMGQAVGRHHDLHRPQEPGDQRRSNREEQGSSY